jgi:hypothetical protein
MCTPKIKNENMRELKFKAWDKINKRMMPSFTLQDCVDGLDTPFKKNCIAGLSDEVYDILEYIGIDKEGNEIYTGHFIKSWVNGHKKNPDEIISLVQWDKEEFTYTGIGGENGCGSNCLVIGNIYENPELKDWQA